MRADQQSTEVMTSQKYFFEIMGYDVIFLQRILSDALIPKISYKGSKFDGIPYKPFKICSGSFSLEPAQNQRDLYGALLYGYNSTLALIGC